MASFGHGGNAKEISRENKINYKDIIDFSANINPLGMSSSVKDAIIEGIDEIEKYPDITYFELKDSIEKFENVSKENLILGNGAAEVLFNAVRGVNPKNSLILAPTFSEYEEAAKAINSNIIYYNLKEENDFNIREDILHDINENLDLVFICNPNNPTGVITEIDLLKRILNKAERNNVRVIIDESFLDFREESFSMIPYIDEYKNLIIIKSLTKFFALPGIRIGYAICSDLTLKEKIETTSPAWNINILAEIATKAALNEKNYIKKSIEFIDHEKKYLYNEIREIDGIKVFEPSVNFILLKTLIKIDLKKELLKNNILIRSCSNYVGLDNRYYRIAVRSHEENYKLIKIMKNIFELHRNEQ
ncbi:threonine-phosphate decarboxylase CobD [Clostridium beijerinckii]|jgi:L-threonine O-3-phosphate decarboxylase (EC 4.1.1.81)|uniref:threonine-phosphate decarboxylase n=2 Tax=Clostridium beijerinckii TaxID=1520 RepID=A0AAE2RVX5_CLOBE|nr:threonine-phosphate decarboxylase CobD [Clostridium beijerinckii]ABR33449.1 putative L-threonine-O-3-phosphate decarboxylase [Clostridium beijerinckii NCIMB 8052]AIU00636.1 threonine-phosphate decarboxylase [Clostridium beijerinckii ATCC 35702]MBC2456793.1 threonine-phosphate decarboxylase [Clostridium beijerinckii]MBC2474835.1 threonine-phosphate decarboxylase [Clostridium beijerinckii]MBF7811651.1 threonine-phosphate decarboxylase [Clostridium beijerinckii]